MSLRIFSVVFILLTIFFALDAFSKRINKSKDSSNEVCYKLNFVKGDSIYYKAISYDSIAFKSEPSLYKKRTETYLLTCDSVNYRGNFVLTIQLVNFNSKEYSINDSVEHSDTPWLGRQIEFEIDSLGNRLGYRYKNSTASTSVLTSSLSPGGAFQPYFLFPFKQECCEVKKTWIVESTDELAENGIPIPLLRYTALFKANESLDTLKYQCNRFEYVKTGQGSISVESPKETITLNSVINSFGRFYISSKYGIPVFFFASMEQKLTYKIPGRIDKTGNHYINTFLTIEKFISPRLKKYKKLR